MKQYLKKCFNCILCFLFFGLTCLIFWPITLLEFAVIIGFNAPGSDIAGHTLLIFSFLCASIAFLTIKGMYFLYQTIKLK